MFISLADFAHYVGSQELADIVSGRIGADIDGAILLGVLKQVEPAATGTLRDAVERIKLALSSADKLAQAYISVRYTQGLSEQDILSSPLPKIVSIIAKHDLMLTTDEDTRYQYGKALEQLKMIANGKMNLSVLDPKPSSKSSTIRVGKTHSSFDLGSFGR